MEQISSPINGTERSDTPKSNKVVKTRAMLTTEDVHPLTKFLMEIKKRGVKNFDASSLVLDAMNSIEDSWWDEKLEKLTPLEYKVSSALSDPKMREKLIELLSSQKLDGNTAIH